MNIPGAPDNDIHRCSECGTWCLAPHPCTTCQLALILRGGLWVQRPGGIRVYRRTAA